jgi:hypothetical protein
VRSGFEEDAEPVHGLRPTFLQPGEHARRVRAARAGSAQGARQRILKTPPGRGSAAQSVIVKPFGAYHLPRCSARVQASNTWLRGASMMRVITMDPGSFIQRFSR